MTTSTSRRARTAPSTSFPWGATARRAVRGKPRTWRTGNDPSATPVRMQPVIRLSRSRGFTLLELLLVMLLLGLLYGLAAPMLGAGSTGLDMKAGSRQLAAGLRKDRKRTR